MKLTIILAFCLTSFCAQAQVNVQTVENVDTAFIDDGLIVGSDNYIYGAHFYGSRIYRISPSGIVSIFADGFNTPNGLAFDSMGNLFVADHSGNAIYKVDPSGTVTPHVLSLGQPSGILKEFDSDTMIVTRYAANLILKIAPDGTIDTISTGGILNGPVGLAYDDDNNLFVANFNDRKLIQIESDGTQGLLAQFPGPGNLGFMTYGNGMFYGTGYDSHKIYQIRQSDTLISLLAGSSIGEVDGDTSIAKFNRPNGIAFNSLKDTLYISAFGTGNVRRITNIINTTGIESIKLDHLELSIFPNPVKESINLRFTLLSAEKLTFSLFDLSGKLVLSTNYLGIKGDNSAEINISQINSGIYFLELSNGRSMVAKKIVISD